MKVPRPISAQGARTARWASHRNHTRAIVASRANGRCEACGASGVPLDLAHLAGRGHLISEPWASSPALCAALCRSCHREADGVDSELRDRLRWLASERLGGPAWSEGVDPLDAIRQRVRELEAAA